MESVIIGTIGLIGLIIIWKIVSKRMHDRDISCREFKIKMLQERNKQVCYFRSRMIYHFGEGIVNQMPMYNEMLYSDKPLEAKQWVNVDKLVNLN